MNRAPSRTKKGSQKRFYQSAERSVAAQRRREALQGPKRIPIAAREKGMHLCSDEYHKLTIRLKAATDRGDVDEAVEIFSIMDRDHLDRISSTTFTLSSGWRLG